ncbi:protein CCSMST1 [Coregonus clupeaformis]|uniref:protein CCSMST1 n=1 Tax=Coregonus clupeaformis TaxID=59861 RepID=UPI001BE07A3F|nr:protein CCSMST1 [Coregonus clupeaformis]
MSRIGRVLSRLSHHSLCRETVIYGTKTKQRLNHARTLSLTSQRLGKSKTADEDGEELSHPIKFTTSKASHKTWNVDQSLGSKYQRPWWKVLPISLFGLSFLLWCALRGETDIDEQLEKNLYEHLPGLLLDEEEEQSKPS